MLVFGGYSHFLNARHIWNNYQRVSGVVIRHETSGGSGYAPIISFQLNGVDHVYRSDIRSDWTARLKVGSECYVLVNPIDNQNVLDGRSSYFWIKAATPLFIGMLAILGGFFWK
jgi:hypothetical protein